MEEKTAQDYINNDVRDDIKILYNHADIANKEMGVVKVQLAGLSAETTWIKSTLEKVDARTWIILGTIILGILVQVLFKILSLSSTTN